MRYILERLFEKLVVASAWKMPKLLAYWAAIRVFSNATRVIDTKAPDKISVVDALRAWEDKL